MSNLSDARENNFNILRLVAASAVIFSHATDITENEEDILAQLTGYSIGWVAVSAFFSISGMLIYLSVVRSQSVWDYVVARSLRIFPGLWVMLVVSLGILGLTIATIPPESFFRNPEVPQYILGNAILYVPQYLLPGLFETNPLPAVNGSLWTLRFEFTCYIITLLLFLVGAYRTQQQFLVMCVVVLVGYFSFLGLGALTGTLDTVLHDGSDFAKLHRLFFAFFLGIVMGRYVHRFRPKGWMVLASMAFCLVFFRTPLFVTTFVAMISMILFWLAFLQHPWLVPFRSMPDYSYGIYIYAFPVQQLVEHLMPEMGWFENALLSLLITLPFAALSWHVIEKPALSLKGRLSPKRATQ